jgi:inorganic triphosphatase YgiF
MAGPRLELEAKLAVISDAPRVVADGIARLESLEDWTLGEPDVISVRDVYFDLPDLPLESKGIALRLRLLGNQHVMTVKGPETRVEDALRREELEQHWSLETLDLIRRRLHDWGIPLPPPPSLGNEMAPSAVIGRWGFVIVQDRGTFRRCRDVWQGAAEAAVTAELAVDEVVYRIGGRNVRHHEVEIELRSGRTAHLGEIVAGLRRRWPELTVWPHSKYATGKALETLLGIPQPELEISGNGDLLPDGYARLERWLGERRH